MDDLITRIRELARETDDAGRLNIQDALRGLQYELESPYETLLRISAQHLQTAGARIGVDLGIFTAVAESEKPVTTTTLAEKSGAALELMGRILRYLASVGMLKEESKDAYSANNITRVLSDTNYQAGIYHCFENIGPVVQALPDFLQETHYQNITESNKTVFQKAFDTDLACFAWLPNQPKRFSYLQKMMPIQRTGDWLSEFPVVEEVGDWKAEEGQAVFVDVGGGRGHQCINFKAKYPKVKGQIILQELAQTISALPPVEGIEFMVQDFFQEQSIKGAKFYYLRNILHDYADPKCIAILRNLLPALTSPSSKILIDDMVLPDTGVHWHATSMDITMMGALGSQERTKSEFERIVEQAGLRIERTVVYTWPVQNAVMVLVKKEDGAGVELKRGLSGEFEEKVRVGE